MIGGLLAVGTPERVVGAPVARGPRGLIVIANDTTRPRVGIGKLIDAGCVARAVVPRVGPKIPASARMPVAQRKMLAGEIEAALMPQGTLAERIRAGGAGLGGMVTPTGVGTVVAEGKRVVELDGRECLLEPPLRAGGEMPEKRRAPESAAGAGRTPAWLTGGGRLWNAKGNFRAERAGRRGR